MTNSPAPNNEFQAFELDDKYLITGLIAEGGMGKVYKGETKLVHRPIAVKVLHSDLVERKDMLMRFNIEAEIASSLNHPNIVNVFGSGVTGDGKPYLVMDYLEGHSLDELLKNHGHVEVKQAISIFKQLAMALEYTHANKVIHRDLKPSNVMLLDDGAAGFTVKLLDFGIAKSTSVEDTIAREITVPGTVFGSVLYMSPEQVLGKPVDYRSDIYSFGCLLFHTLTGKPPYEARNPVDCMQMHIDENIPNLVDFIPEAPFVSDLAAIINTCLRKDPVQRFENSKLLLAAVEKIYDDFNVAAKAAAEAAALASKSVAQSPADGSVDQALATARARENRMNNVLAVASVAIVAVGLGLVPFLYDLDLAKIERQIQTRKSDQQKSAKDKNAEAAQEASKKVDELLEQVGSAISQKNFSDAEKLARTAYLSSLSLPPDDPRIAEALFLLGQVFELEKNYQGALQAYNWTLSFREAKFGPMAPQTTSVQQRIAVVKSFLQSSSGQSPPPRIQSN